MNEIIRHIIRFFILIILQTLVLNQIEPGWGIQLMPYPLFIFLLPIEIGLLPLMLLAFLMGISIDSLSNTYGLHASSLLVFAYMRPMIFELFTPRDGYDPLLQPTLFDMGAKWFYKTFGLLLLIHHFWFFLLEILHVGQVLFILQKTVLSIFFGFLLCVLYQYLFIGKKQLGDAER